MSWGTNASGLLAVMAVFLSLGAAGDRVGVAEGPLNLLGGGVILAGDLFYRKVWHDVPFFAWGQGGWLLFLPLWAWGCLWLISGTIRTALGI